MRRTVSFFLVLLLFVATAGCDLFSADSSSPPPPQWSVSGLKGRDVWALKTYNQRLYAATDSGLYRRPLTPGSEWTMDGLAGKWIIDLTWRKDGSLLAGIRYPDEVSEKGPVLYKRAPSVGAEWSAFEAGYGPKGDRTVRALAAVPGARDTLFARGSRHVAGSTDGATHWNAVWGDWGQLGYQAPLLYVSPHDPSMVFAGGENSTFQPYLVRSPDSGATWARSGPSLGEGDNAVYSMIEHPKNPKHFLLGLEGYVLRSTDGGQSWSTIYEPPAYTYVFDFAAYSTPDHTVVYAAGSENGAQAGPLALHRTENFGDSWERIVHTSGPDSTAVRTVTHAEVNNRPRLYLGTLNGVYVYRP
ncbi:MAG: WD40/YVTN/BNR-like repeat-containing protein [Salinibacter sp.]